jgi:hypothetical protein
VVGAVWGGGVDPGASCVICLLQRGGPHCAVPMQGVLLQVPITGGLGVVGLHLHLCSSG